jgi:hypothetical protein
MHSQSLFNIRVIRERQREPGHRLFTFRDSEKGWAHKDLETQELNTFHHLWTFIGLQNNPDKNKKHKGKIFVTLINVCLASFKI